MKRTIRSLVLAGAVVTSLAAIDATPALAKDGDVRVNGRCTGNSTSKLKLGPRGSTIELDFEVDQNRNGQPWRVRITDNGSVVYRGTVRTVAPSGSFSVERVIPNRAGTDRVVAVATNRPTGERCRAVARV